MRTAWRLGIGVVDGEATGEGATAADGAIAPGPQAVPITTTAAAAKAILSVLFTG
jgi:hypothetical protein